MREARCFCKGAKAGDVLIAYARPDEMSKLPHSQILSRSERLSSGDLTLRARISRRR